MADDTTPSSVLSTPQATANLDDVLASLEKQVSTPVVAPGIQTAPIPTPTPVDIPQPVATVAPFQIEEAPIQSAQTLSAPVAEVMPAPESVQDHPAMEVATPAPTASPTPKPNLFSRFSFNPKFAIGALVVAVMAIGAVGTYLSYFAPQGSLDTRKHACTWITTGCGSGCSDNKDLFNPACVGNGGGVSNSTPPLGSDTRTCSNGWTKGTINCIGADQYSCTLNPDLLRIGCCPGAQGDTCRGTTTPGGGSNTTVSTTCGGSGQACCVPQNFPGQSVANCTGTLKCTNGTCQAGQTNSTQCVVYNCGSKCDAGIECKSGMSGPVSCATASLGGSCGQIDYVDASGNYAGVQTQNCYGSCNGVVSSNPPTTQPTPTSTPVCNSTCTTAANCPTGLTCSAGHCRNSACLTATSCTCLTVTPTPTPSPSSPLLVCLNITKDVAAPVLGSQVRFTCGPVSGATSYEFRYKYTASGSAVTQGTINANQHISDPFVISTAAAYKVQCRPCAGQACTEWEAW